MKLYYIQELIDITIYSKEVIVLLLPLKGSRPSLNAILTYQEVLAASPRLHPERLCNLGTLCFQKDLFYMIQLSVIVLIE